MKRNKGLINTIQHTMIFLLKISPTFIRSVSISIHNFKFDIIPNSVDRASNWKFCEEILTESEIQDWKLC